MHSYNTNAPIVRYEVETGESRELPEVFGTLAWHKTVVTSKRLSQTW